MKAKPFLLYSMVFAVIFSLSVLGVHLQAPEEDGPRNKLLRADPSAPVREYIPRLEKNLQANIAAFWLANGLDFEHGGYRTALGPKGEPRTGNAKTLVSQARMVWFFSRMAREGYGDRQRLLEAATLGYRFLREKMWDRKYGGFYWEVEASGSRKLKNGKHLYGQAFALSAITEYYLATRRQEVLDFALDFFSLLESKAYDRDFGGYQESFQRDWSALPPMEKTYIGSLSGEKTMNTHLHIIEALTGLYRASGRTGVKERLSELTMIAVTAFVRTGPVICTDKYSRDWKPGPDTKISRVSYGHNLELIWVLTDACAAADIPVHPLRGLFENLFGYCLTYGYDSDKSGFYRSGPVNHPADDRIKVWWVQAEALPASLSLYRLTGDRRYLSVFQETYSFIEKTLVDWEHGEWYETATPDGSFKGDKAHAWKAAFHNGRAMIECLGMLKELTEGHAPSLSY